MSFVRQFYHRPNDQRQKHKGHYRPWGKKRKFNDCFAEDVSPEKITEKEKDEVNNKVDIVHFIKKLVYKTLRNEYYFFRVNYKSSLKYVFLFH